jgi:Zn-dependent protease
MNPRICTLFGVPLHFHISFIIFFFIFSFLYPAQILALAVIFASVVAHEYGHVLAAKYCGVDTKLVTLTPLGGLALLVNLPRDPTKEILIAGAGPLVSLILALWSGALALITFMITDFFIIVGLANLILFVFNVLPVMPLDGGRLFRAFLHYWYDYQKSTKIAVRVGQGMAALIIIFGVISFQFLLVITMVIIALAAESELRVAKVS